MFDKESFSQQSAINSLTQNSNNSKMETLISTFESISQNQIETVQEQIKNPLIEIWKYTDDSLHTILHIACKNNLTQMVMMILREVKKRLGFANEAEFKTFINSQNSQGFAAIHFAVEQGNIHIVKELLNNKVNYELITTNRGLNCMHIAAKENKVNMLMYFKEVLKFSIEVLDEEGSTPLHWASYSKSLDTATCLLHWNCLVNERDKQGSTPLHFAVENNNIPLIRLLLQYNANTFIKNHSGKTPFSLAKEKELYDVLTIFKQNIKTLTFENQYPSKRAKSFCIQEQLIYLIGNFFSLIFIALPTYLTFSKSDEFISIIVTLGILFICETLFYTLTKCIDPCINISNSLLNFNDQTLQDIIEEGNEDLKNYCFVCFIRKEHDIRHCVICNKCVKGYNHHCFWVNNCIGERNYFVFVCFICFMTLYVIFILILSGFTVYFVINHQPGQSETHAFIVKKALNITLGIIDFVMGIVLSFIMVKYLFSYIRKICSQKEDHDYNMLNNNSNNNLNVGSIDLGL